jgi:hypothetical protein
MADFVVILDASIVNIALPSIGLLTDTLDGDDGAIGDGDRGDERPNDQRGGGGAGNGLAMKSGGVGKPAVVVAR